MTHSFLSLIRLRSSFNSSAFWLWQTSLTMSIRFYWMYCDLTETLPLLRVLCSFSKRIGDNANTHTHMRMCYACDTIVLRSRWDTTIEWVSNGSFCMCEINDKYLLPIDDCTPTKWKIDYVCLVAWLFVTQWRSMECTLHKLLNFLVYNEIWRICTKSGMAAQFYRKVN